MNEFFILLRNLIKSSRLSEAKVDSLLADVDLSTTKLLTLRHLIDSDESVSLGQLASCMAFAKSNATQLVDNLEAASLVKRVPDPCDRRSTRLDLTEAGKQQHEAALQAVQPLVEQLDALYTPEERVQLVSLLQRLSDVMK
jgi:DNA-binding MarR family transcriptional regulator